MAERRDSTKGSRGREQRRARAKLRSLPIAEAFHPKVRAPQISGGTPFARQDKARMPSCAVLHNFLHRNSKRQSADGAGWSRNVNSVNISIAGVLCCTGWRALGGQTAGAPPGREVDALASPRFPPSARSLTSAEPETGVCLPHGRKRLSTEVELEPLRTFTQVRTATIGWSQKGPSVSFHRPTGILLRTIR